MKRGRKFYKKRYKNFKKISSLKSIKLTTTELLRDKKITKNIGSINGVSIKINIPVRGKSRTRSR